MAVSYEMRRLDSLPWPTSIGKDLEYPGLRGKVLARLGPGPDAFKTAFEGDSTLRSLIGDALSSAPWAPADLSDVDHLYSCAAQSSLLYRMVNDDISWRRWADPLQQRNGRLVFDWLCNPIRITVNGIGDGRHRLTYLRLHRCPAYLVLVRINHAR
jgi:hypothetical protein